ncbi:MAG: type IV pilus assembly protein PilM [Acidimicrobiales bacterium]
MAHRATGVDIGSFGVRAAEVSVEGGVVTLSRFGQVALPPGAVVGGEVVDPETVSLAVRRLWKEARFSARKVVVGVANTKLVVRQAELPSMPEDELRSALGFQAAELIPIPLDDAQLDFQVLEDTVDSEGVPRTRILLAAAQRAMVQSALSAVHGAGLRATLVDPVPLATVRALAVPSTDVLGEEGAGAEAIVSIGAGVISVLVHENGVPRFVRISLGGGDAVTELLARELGVSFEEAEDTKRRLGAAEPAPGLERAAGIVAGAVTSLADDIRGSIDFYGTQPGARPISRLLLTGGGSRTAGIFEALAGTLRRPVEPGRLLHRIRADGAGLDSETLTVAEPLLAVPVGLALAGLPDQAGRRRVNLLPTSVNVRRRERSEAAAVAGVVALVALGLSYAWISKGDELRNQQQSLAAEQAQVSTLQGEVGKLHHVAVVDSQVTKGSQVVKDALAGDVDWTRLLTQVAGALPRDVWLTTFQGTAGSPTSPGTLTVGGKGFDHTATAAWITDESKLASLSDVYVSSSTRAANGGPATFASTADLTPAIDGNRVTYYTAPGGGAAQ